VCKECTDSLSFSLAFSPNRQFNSATDEQLFDALERTQLENSSLENFPSIAQVFRTWSNNAGYPILNVHLSRDKNENAVKMHISQELFAPLINETETSEFFILFNYATSQRASVDYWLPEKSEWHWIHNENISETEIELVGEPDWVIFNLQQTGEQSFI
jgi:aminopeptidase N